MICYLGFMIILRNTMHLDASLQSARILPTPKTITKVVITSFQSAQ